MEYYDPIMARAWRLTRMKRVASTVCRFVLALSIGLLMASCR